VHRKSTKIVPAMNRPTINHGRSQHVGAVAGDFASRRTKARKARIGPLKHDESVCKVWFREDGTGTLERQICKSVNRTRRRLGVS